ncbi:MAG TPA: N-acetyl-gamma-glutamyl-phosphate reductase [Solirubrobacteraceae bacterium]|nr:N-acetyl-gamma-glutamyl-phosphate reductase [Solirubrobacteraceae bacterium]
MSCVVEQGQRFASGSPRVLVAGATGFAGALAAHLLWRHPRFELAGVTGRSEVGRRLDELYPRYRVPLTIEELDLDRSGGESPGSSADASPAGAGGGAGAGRSAGTSRGAGLDAAVVAYPHAVAAPTVAMLRERGVRVVDLSADFRLADLATYERWYGPHPRPELLAQAVYGLTELHRERIASAGIVANPGCYPTAAVLGLAPLARAGLIGDVVIDAKQGISGAGRAFDETTHLSMAGENILPYKVAAHRHTPEIEQQLDELNHINPSLRVQFQAHLVPLDQGELASCYVTSTRPVSEAQLGELYQEAYAAEPFVEVVDGPPGVREVLATNYCRLFAAADSHTGKVLVFSAIDNLWKGTSSQAVQNLNVMFGHPETEGLV